MLKNGIESPSLKNVMGGHLLRPESELTNDDRRKNDKGDDWL
jgi:hypothetical protein